MRVNSTGVFLASQIFSEPMQAQRSGSIVNISSIYGVVGPDFHLRGHTMSDTRGLLVCEKRNHRFDRATWRVSWPFGVRANCNLARRILDRGHARGPLSGITPGGRFSSSWLFPRTSKGPRCSWLRTPLLRHGSKTFPWMGAGRQSRRPRYGMPQPIVNQNSD